MPSPYRCRRAGLTILLHAPQRCKRNSTRLTNQAGPCVRPRHVKYHLRNQTPSQSHPPMSQQTRVSHICHNLHISTPKFLSEASAIAFLFMAGSRQYLSSYPSPLKAILPRHPIRKAICYKKSKEMHPLSSLPNSTHAVTPSISM